MERGEEKISEARFKDYPWTCPRCGERNLLVEDDEAKKRDGRWPGSKCEKCGQSFALVDDSGGVYIVC